ncbi:ankyrin repeat-containing domain protein [Chlamydoabsidia padenii]|nr:ankyrin repeat-containing domain protein [Chlamydoabsidia padenii]
MDQRQSSTPPPPSTPTSPRGHSSSSKSRPSLLTDPNRTDKAGRTKLFAYTSSGHLDKVKELVKQGADVNFKDHAGWVPLHEAALKGQYSIASYFIDCGANVNVRGYGDDTPLHDACTSGYADIVQLLVNSGADVYALNSDKQQPIDVCEDQACERILQTKMKQLDRLVARDSTGRTTLHRVCADGLYDEVASLVKQGANVNSEDNKQWTPIHEAARHGHLAIVRLLVQHGADINHAGYQGTSVLHHACRSGHDQVVDFLIEQGVDIHAVNDAGKTAYQVTTSASIRRDLAAKIDEERKQRATSDAIDEITFTTLRQRKLTGKSSSTSSPSSKNTPLSREERKIQAIMRSFEALEQQQPKQTQPSRPARTARRRDIITTVSGSAAAKRGYKDTDDDEYEHQDQHTTNDDDEDMEDDNEALNPLATTTTISTRRKKRSQQRQSRSRTPTRTPPTRSPSRERSVDSLDNSVLAPPTKKMDPTKLDPHKKDTSGRTHLHRWAIRGDVDVVRVLLQAGADPNVTDHAGYTPLHEAALRNRGNVVRLLLENGANVNAKGVDLDTALHDAIDNGHPDVVEILLQFGADPHIRNSKGMSPMEMAKELDLVDVHVLLKQAIANEKVKKESGLSTNITPKKQTKKRRLVLAADLEHSSSTPTSSSTSPTYQRPSTPELVNIKIELSSRTDNPMDIHMLTDERPPQPSTVKKSRKKDPVPVLPLSPKPDGPHTPIPGLFGERWLGKKVKEEDNTNNSNTTLDIHGDLFFHKSTTSTTPKPPKIKTGIQPRSRTLSEAIRYLPLYTVQLIEEDGKQSSLYVLDLQVGLLLNLTTDHLWQRYPSLCRRQVTINEKERLWSPLASMVCAAACSEKTTVAVGLTLRDQEKQRFLDRPLYFVRLDPVVSLIKHDYGYLSKNLITINLDIGYQQDDGFTSPSSSSLPSIAPTLDNNNSNNNNKMSKTPIKKRLPPKFALKMQRQAIHQHSNSNPSSPLP